MKKHFQEFGLFVCLAAALCLLPGNLTRAQVKKTKPKADSRPNIIFILVDDLDLKSMPYLKKLKSIMIDQGTSFNHAIITNSVCCPSRASSLRGQYSHNTGVIDNDNVPYGDGEAEMGTGFQVFHQKGYEDSTIATWLHDVGYRTVLIGKYLNGYESSQDITYIPPGWDEWYSSLKGFGDASDNAEGADNRYFHYRLSENGKIVYYGYDEKDYSTDVFAQKAVDFINRSSKKPFFMYLAPNAPHNPFTPAPRYKGVFKDLPLPQSPSFNEADISDKPPMLQAAYPNQFDQTEIDRLTGIFRNRLEAALALEDLVESVIQALSDNHVLDNTYIFFTSDNGFHEGEHRMGKGKGMAYEEDIRVPFMVRGPNVPAGKSLDNYVMNHDIPITFADLAHTSVPDFVDGKSIKSLLGATAESSLAFRRRVLLERPTITAVRTDFDKYIENIAPDGHIEYEYYVLKNGPPLKDIKDVVEDPYELENKVYDPAYQARIQNMKDMLSKLKACKGQECRDAEGPPDPNQFPPAK